MEYWQYHNQKIKELKQIYNRISKQTQNKLQEIFDSFNIDFEYLYNISDNKTKNKMNIYIEEWRDKGLLTGYFGMLAKNIYNRTRVKNSEILELLIYSAYIEEQSKLEETELNTFKDVANYYYKQGQEEVNNTLSKKKRKKVSVIPDAIFLALLDMPNAKGYIWKQYIESTVKYNAEQIYRQMTIDLQQKKELDITNDIYQNIIKRQQNSKLSIKDDKISGNIDLTLIGINNMAKIEGIKTLNKNAKVKFVSDMCENVTVMCSNMNGYIFNVNDWNEFDRWYGETAKELKIERIKIKGLVLGVNLPPIRHHFHWCHSYIIYLQTLEKQEKAKYNILNYIRKNSFTSSKNLDKEIKKAIEFLSTNVRNLLKDTKFYIANDNSYYDRKKDEIHLLKDADKYEILHEIGHTIETKLDILHNKKYTQIQQNGIEVQQINIDNIEGYDKKYEFWLNGDKFISEYQRMVYEYDIDKNERLNFLDYTFNTKTLGEYFSEGFRCYFENNKLLKRKDIDLYNYIKGVLR